MQLRELQRKSACIQERENIDKMCIYTQQGNAAVWGVHCCKQRRSSEKAFHALVFSYPSALPSQHAETGAPPRWLNPLLGNHLHSSTCL